VLAGIHSSAAGLRRPSASTLAACKSPVCGKGRLHRTERLCGLRRLVQAYNQAAATLNLLRGFSTGGYAGLQRVTQWNLDFMDKSDEGQVCLCSCQGLPRIPTVRHKTSTLATLTERALAGLPLKVSATDCMLRLAQTQDWHASWSCSLPRAVQLALHLI
jgi:hypothetical protein